MSPIIDIQRRFAPLGRIRIGAKTDKGYPKRLTKFRLTSASRALLEGAATQYGGTPQPWENGPEEGLWELYTDTAELDVLLPPVLSQADGTPTLPYSQWYELWSAGGCQRRCDGRTEILTNKPCVCLAEGDEPDNRTCGVSTRLSVMLPKIPGLGVWTLQSGGWNAAAILPGTLDVLMLAASQRQFIPAVLRLEQRTSKKDGETHRFVVPVVDLPEVRLEDFLADQLAPGATLTPLEGPPPTDDPPDPAGQPALVNPPQPRGPKPALPPASELPPTENQIYEAVIEPEMGAPPLAPSDQAITETIPAEEGEGAAAPNVSGDGMNEGNGKPVDQMTPEELEVARLSTADELLRTADQLGSQLDAVLAAIAANRETLGLAEHVAWLDAQLARAKARLAEQQIAVVEQSARP